MLCAGLRCRDDACHRKALVTSQLGLRTGFGSGVRNKERPRVNSENGTASSNAGTARFTARHGAAPTRSQRNGGDPVTTAGALPSPPCPRRAAPAPLRQPPACRPRPVSRPRSPARSLTSLPGVQWRRHLDPLGDEGGEAGAIQRGPHRHGRQDHQHQGSRHPRGQTPARRRL